MYYVQYITDNISIKTTHLFDAVTAKCVRFTCKLLLYYFITR